MTQLFDETIMRIAGSLESIDKTLSEPKNISAHRVAANRRISSAIAYIDACSNRNEGTINSEEAPQEVTDVLKFTNQCLTKIRSILLKSN